MFIPICIRIMFFYAKLNHIEHNIDFPFCFLLKKGDVDVSKEDLARLKCKRHLIGIYVILHDHLIKS